MKYANGDEIRVGDKVKVWEGCTGIVVASMDTDEYSTEHPRELSAFLLLGNHC